YFLPTTPWTSLHPAVGEPVDNFRSPIGRATCPQLVPRPSTGFAAGGQASFAELADELVPVLAELAVGLRQGADLPAGMQDRGVVPTREGVADFRQAVLGQLLGQ